MYLAVFRVFYAFPESLWPTDGWRSEQYLLKSVPPRAAALRISETKIFPQYPQTSANKRKKPQTLVAVGVPPAVEGGHPAARSLARLDASHKPPSLRIPSDFGFHFENISVNKFKVVHASWPDALQTAPRRIAPLIEKGPHRHGLRRQGPPRRRFSPASRHTTASQGGTKRHYDRRPHCLLPLRATQEWGEGRGDVCPKFRTPHSAWIGEPIFLRPKGPTFLSPGQASPRAPPWVKARLTTSPEGATHASFSSVPFSITVFISKLKKFQHAFLAFLRVFPARPPIQIVAAKVTNRIPRSALRTPHWKSHGLRRQGPPRRRFSPAIPYDRNHQSARLSISAIRPHFVIGHLSI